MLPSLCLNYVGKGSTGEAREECHGLASRGVVMEQVPLVHLSPMPPVLTKPHRSDNPKNGSLCCSWLPEVRTTATTCARRNLKWLLYCQHLQFLQHKVKFTGLCAAFWIPQQTAC